MAREAYLRHIGEILEDHKTVVFLDTNILAYLYKLLGAARTEFFVWAEGLISDNRLKIPAWALSEYLAKLTAKKLDDYTARSKEPDEIRRKLVNLRNIANLFVDDAVLGKAKFAGTRDAFFDEFDLAIDKLNQLNRVFTHEFDAATIHQEIAAKLSIAVMASNIGDLAMRANREGEMRIAQRMPPGFRDGGKGENKFGDLIIWFELLQYAVLHKSDFDKVVFLSNDEKTDWVYVPSHRTEILGGKAKVVPNVEPSIKLADPRLVAEFHSLVGHRELHMVSLAAFVEGLSMVRSSGVENLALAIQVDVEKAVSERPRSDSIEQVIVSGDPQVSAGAESLLHGAPAVVAAAGGVDSPEGNVGLAEAEQSSDSAEDLQAVEVVPNASVDIGQSYAPDALRDGAYEPDESSDLDIVIRDLSSHNWYTQNPAITRLKGLRDGFFSNEAWFVLGRNIYQAACGNAQKALEFIRDFDIQLSRFPDDVAIHILNGALFEVYFDGEANFRKSPKSGQIDPVFRAALGAQHQAARDFISKQLEPYASQLVLIPGMEGPCRLSIEVTSAMVIEANAVCDVLSSVEFMGHQLLFDVPEVDEKVSAFLTRYEKRWTLDAIQAAISEKWVVPSWQFESKVTPAQPADTSFFVPDGKVLRTANLLKAK